jgi:hypothetical protein
MVTMVMQLHWRTKQQPARRALQRKIGKPALSALKLEMLCKAFAGLAAIGLPNATVVKTTKDYAKLALLTTQPRERTKETALVLPLAE